MNNDLKALNIMLGDGNQHIWLCPRGKTYLASFILISDDRVHLGTCRSDARTIDQHRAFGVKWKNNINDEPQEIPYDCD